MFFLNTFCLTSLYSQNDKQLENLNKEFNQSVYTNFIEAKKTAFRGLELSEKVKDTFNLYQFYSNLIKIHILSGEYDKANFFLEKALTIEDEILDDTLKIDLYNNASYLEILTFNSNNALTYSEKAIAISIKRKDSLKLCESYLISANLLINRQEKKRATKRLNQVIKIAKRHNYYKALSSGFSSLAEINYTKKVDSANYYYNQALDYAILGKNKAKQGSLYADFAFFNLYHANLDKVQKLIDKAEIIAKEVGDKKTLHVINYTLGYYNESLGNFSTAVNYYKKAINNYGNYIGPIQLSNAYLLLSGALFHNNQFKEAYNYQYQYLDLNDSIFNLKKSKEFDVLRTEYDVEKKNNQITLLETENQLAATKRKWLIISSILSAIPLIVLFLFYRHRAKTQRTIRIQEKEIHTKEKLRLQKEQELTQVKALIEGQDKERNRIAKELHDGVGGQLASVNMSLSHVNSTLKNPKINDLGKVLSKTFNELRELSHSLSANYLKDKSFESLLAELKTQYESTNNFNIEISIFPEECLTNLALPVKHNLYRILQEVLANSSKYANAKLIQLSINKHNDTLVVMIEDDGDGFDLKTNKNGIGLKNIKERVVSLKGTINIESTKNLGTHITIEIPLTNN